MGTDLGATEHAEDLGFTLCVESGREILWWNKTLQNQSKQPRRGEIKSPRRANAGQVGKKLSAASGERGWKPPAARSKGACWSEQRRRSSRNGLLSCTRSLPPAVPHIIATAATPSSRAGVLPSCRPLVSASRWQRAALCWSDRESPAPVRH